VLQQRLMAIALANNRRSAASLCSMCRPRRRSIAFSARICFRKISATGVEQVEKYPAGVLEPVRVVASTGDSRNPAGRTIRFLRSELDLHPMSSTCSARSSSLNHAAFGAVFRECGDAAQSRSSRWWRMVASAYLAILADETYSEGDPRDARQAKTASYDLTKRSPSTRARPPPLALSQAATTVDTARANLAEYTRQAAQDRNVLMVLLGTPIPEDIVFSTDINAEDDVGGPARRGTVPRCWLAGRTSWRRSISSYRPR